MADQHHTKTRMLLKKYLAGRCTEAEKAWVEEWYLSVGQQDMNQLNEKEIQEDFYELRDTLFDIAPKRLSFYPYAAIAVLFAMLGVAVIWWNNVLKTSVTVSELVSADSDVMPGTNRATLSFDESDEIELSGTQEGLVNDGSAIVYKDGTKLKTVEKVQIATLRTPAAGQYQVTLPDGTKAWLNALSSVRYPTAFTGKERKITITGEVYLEVTHDGQRPFIVETEHQYIRVMGTSFNINAYGDNGQTQTTLVEGAVQISHAKSGGAVDLVPGQQAVVDSREVVDIKTVDIEEVSSWKDGLYMVNDEPLEQYARKIERWYNVEVDMKPYGNKHLSAIIPRDAKLSEVLQAIELQTGVQFTIEGRRVQVKK